MPGRGELLLMSRGGLLSKAFIMPPSRIGTYVTSHCLNAGEFYDLVGELLLNLGIWQESLT